MRKRIIAQESLKTPVAQPEWLDLARLEQVEVTSEDAAHPIESALVAGSEGNWRASESGKQSIRLLFDAPQAIKRILLRFRDDSGHERTQEIVLRAASGSDQPSREIVRQQYNFSAPDATAESEDYTVNLAGVTMLELVINPNIGGGETRASLEQMRVA